MGVAYGQDDIEGAKAALQTQAEEIASRLKEQGGLENTASKEIVALMAFLKRLGKDAASETNRAEE